MDIVLYIFIVYMSVVTNMSASSSYLPLEEAIRSNPGLEVEFKPVIPLGDKIVPYMWVSNNHIDDIKQYLESENERGLENYEIVDYLGDRALVKVEWDKENSKLLGLITDYNGMILDMKGKKDNWDITLQFLEQQQLSKFYNKCKQSGINLKIDKVENLKGLEEFLAPKLSDKQTEALTIAYKQGYFDIPRQKPAKKISKELNISDSAFSQRLRRGIKKLIETQILNK